MLSRNNRGSTLLLSGFAGSILLCGADILVRCVATVELPVSIFTSLIGAPVLVLLIIRGRRKP
jgi:iron complex transport system permease protein